jgi:hypothetical protein
MKIQPSMKSYFQEGAMVDVYVQNADIFKRKEKEGVVPYDLNNSNYWLFHLEENLAKQMN